MSIYDGIMEKKVGILIQFKYNCIKMLKFIQGEALVETVESSADIYHTKPIVCRAIAKKKVIGTFFDRCQLVSSISQHPQFSEYPQLLA